VPMTTIARVDLFINQYIGQLIAPFSLYIQGWNAFNMSTQKVRYVTVQ
jgi:hypothetical protein